MIARRYSKRGWGDDAVTDVLALVFTDIIATSNDHRLIQMSRWVGELTGRPMPIEVFLPSPGRELTEEIPMIAVETPKLH
ncbi:MAG: hypothetical protein HYY22_07890 [Thaumarchaeota archaeon]|nr:hypothetical protein [Nitrososphaerota archaeon]